MNFRRRIDVKRRALTNLLSDPGLLERYKDRFPAKRSLESASDVASDYFATYYNKSEYVSALALNFLTCTAALVFVLAKIGLPAPFLSESAASIIDKTTWGGAVSWALVGSYLSNCYDLIRRTSNFDLAPDVFTKMWVKLCVAAAAAAIISHGILTGLQPAVGFGIGLISIPVLFDAMSEKASKALSIKTTQGDMSTLIKELQGATPDVIDRLVDIDIYNTVQLAYCDPMKLIMSTNLGWVVIIDLIDQALLFNYVGVDVAKLRRGGYRGAIEVATIGVHLNGDPQQRISGLRSLKGLAQLLGWSDQTALDLVQTLYTDSQVNLIWDLFGGNYRERDKNSLPINNPITITVEHKIGSPPKEKVPEGPTS